MTRPRIVIPLVAVALLACGETVLGQSLLRRPSPTAAPVMVPGAAPGGATPASTGAPPTAPSGGAPATLPGGTAARTGTGQAAGPSAAMRSYSLLAVVPPPPRQYAKHDQVQVIINETSIQKHEQSLETEKKNDLTARLSGLPSVRNLLQAQLKPGDSTLLDATLSGNVKFEGDGTYERKDNFTTRIAAVVLDVKPNGTLVLEARTSVMNNGQNYCIVVAGLCRPEDITANNTVQSSQLADLVIRVENEGEVNDAGKKGWLSRFFDAVFNF
jgi:flagellar L-ring protein precursor FlgH